MSNELQYYGDPVVDTGLTVVARVYDSSGVQVGSDVATTEVGALAIYRGNMPVAVEGNYGVRFFSDTLLLGQETIFWDGTAEKINASTSDVTAIIAQVDANETKIDLIETKAQADARQALLIAEHDTTQAALITTGQIRSELATELGRIDVAVSSRNTIAPDNAGITAIKAKTDNLPASPAAVSDIPTVSQIADGVWDEVLTGATHNVPASAGRRVRQLASSIIIDGTAVSATTNTIVLDSDASSSNGAYDPAIIHISAGTGTGQSRIILEYNGSTKTAIVNRDWKVTPNATSEYVIEAHSDNASVNEGLAQGGSTNTITLNALASDDNDSYVGQSVFIVSGNGADQLGLVIDYNGTTKVATIAGNWAHAPNATSGYVMLPNSPVLLGATTHTGATIPTVTVITDPVVTDTASREASKATGFATPANVTDAQTALTTEINANEAKIDSLETKAARLDALLEDSAGDRFTAKALETAPTAEMSEAELHTALDSYTNKAIWKADISGLALQASLLTIGDIDARLTAYGAPTLTEMTTAFTEIKGATWTVTDTLEAIRDAVTAGGTSITAADVLAELKPDLTIINEGVKSASLIVPHSTDLT
jgi:hypothetical protein